MNKTIGLIIGLVLIAAAAVAVAVASMKNDSDQTINTVQTPNQENNPTSTEQPATSNKKAETDTTQTSNSTTQTSSIKLLAPNGGSYLLGSRLLINWVTESSSDITISLVNASGQEVGVIVTAKAGQTEYVWYPGTVTKNGQSVAIKGDSYYKIKVTLSNGIYDLSDNAFELAYGGPPNSR